MDQIAVETTQVVVLSDGETPAAISNKRGHLFEQFAAQLLGVLGYDQPRRENLNVSSEGIELDVTARAMVTRQPLIAECKAYSTSVSAAQINSFLGKYAVKRVSEQQLAGLFIALPRLTAQGNEQATAAEQAFPLFRHLGSHEIVELLQGASLLPPETDGPALRSDLTVVVTEHGLALAAKELDPKTRRATRVAVWGRSTVPDPILELLARTPFADGLAVARYGIEPTTLAPRVASEPPTIILVRGSGSDFEYQLPAASRYFVGRKAVDDALTKAIAERSGGGTLVVNAKSGWGKSSLALRLARRAEQAGGLALVVDSRTAERTDFVTAVLEALAQQAAEKRLLTLPTDATFSSVTSAIRTLDHAAIRGRSRPLLVFFDQFENVFRYEALTRAFRDLALMVQEVGLPLTVGFAWKTDLVGWTEGHPYQLRDEIRDSATVTILEPLGPAEIGTLLGRLEKASGQKLSRDLRRRLREYSQGLPWLFKKLGGHIISELHRGVTQEHLVREALNVQTLFESDLAELNPAEQEALRLIARAAPVPVSELEESVPTPILQSLLNKRLVVQVGERIDTYWDTFRDFLVTGRVAVEDSYIVRFGPVSVGKLLRRLIAADGELSVPDAASQLNTSANVIFNLSRELRQFGLAAAESNTVAVDPGVLAADDPEATARERTASALRRHKVLPIITSLVNEAAPSPVPLSRFASELPAAFPAIEANEGTWLTYARAFGQWLAFANLVQLDRDGISRAEDDMSSAVHLLAGAAPVRVHGAFPQGPAGPAEQLLLHLADPANNARPTSRNFKSGLRELTILRAVILDAHDNVTLVSSDLVSNGRVVPEAVEALVRLMPGADVALDSLRAEPWRSPGALGLQLRETLGAEWSEATTVSSGKYLRSWARLCGIPTRLKPPGSVTTARDPQ